MNLQEINVKLDVFEGPLDLLLHLIKRLEIDIYDIPIAAVTEQYLTYIHTMKNLELEVAGEYLVMAATLMAIKSQMLLPQQEVELAEEMDEIHGEDPREALVSQLLEYRKFKYAAKVLHEKQSERSLYYTKEPTNIEIYKEETFFEKTVNQMSSIDLFLAFHSMLEKKKKQGVLGTTIVGENISIEEKIMSITEKISCLDQRTPINFEKFFSTYSRQEIVTTFMALLELIKNGSIYVEQQENYSTILLYNRIEND